MKMIIKRGDTIENIISVEKGRSGEFNSTKIFSIDDAKKRYDELKAAPVTPVTVKEPVVEKVETASVYGSTAVDQDSNFSTVERLAIERARMLTRTVPIIDTIVPKTVDEEPIDADFDEEETPQDQEDDDSEMIEEAADIESEEINDQMPGYTTVYVGTDQEEDSEESNFTDSETV